MSIQYSERDREIEDSNRRRAEMEYYESMTRYARAHAMLIEREDYRRAVAETSNTGTLVLFGVALVVTLVIVKYVAAEAHLSF